jgi:hypothetical protein
LNEIHAPEFPPSGKQFVRRMKNLKQIAEDINNFQSRNLDESNKSNGDTVDFSQGQSGKLPFNMKWRSRNDSIFHSRNKSINQIALTTNSVYPNFETKPQHVNEQFEKKKSVNLMQNLRKSHDDLKLIKRILQKNKKSINGELNKLRLVKKNMKSSECCFPRINLYSNISTKDLSASFLGT